MGTLEGRVAVITGAGNGIGREHALLFAAEGARVVVNDLGANADGSGADVSAAQQVVDEIRATGGDAAANHDDISDWSGAQAVIRQAVDTYGRLDVLVNNAGILRDAFLHRMTESEWDLVVRVHLKGHFATTRHAAEHWKIRAKDGETFDGAVINTASMSGVTLANPGQANYGAAKAGIAALTLIAAAELERLGVRVNAIAPAARTRLTADVPGFVGEMMKEPEDPDALDVYGAHQISPLVAHLASEGCSLSGKVFEVQGGRITELEGWTQQRVSETESDWTVASVAEGLRPEATV